MKGSQGLGVKKHEGESRQICRAGVRTIKEGFGNHGTMLLVVEHAKQDINLHADFLHRNYIPETHKPCTLSPRPYVNPRTLMPLTLKHSDHAFGGPGCRAYGYRVCVALPDSAKIAFRILGLQKLQGD